MTEEQYQHIERIVSKFMNAIIVASFIGLQFIDWFIIKDLPNHNLVYEIVGLGFFIFSLIQIIQFIEFLKTLKSK